VKIHDVMKNYYKERLAVFTPAEKIKAPLLERAAAEAGERRPDRRAALVFHAVLTVILGITLWSNQGTTRSLERIDPENTRIRRVEESLRHGLSALRSAAVRTAPSPEKGENP